MQSRTHGSTIVFGLLAVLSVSGFVAAQTPVPIGNEFQVNTYTTGAQMQAKLAILGSGGFVVVWRSFGSNDMDTSGTSIQGQLFDVAGSAAGSQFQVNTYTTRSQGFPSVAADKLGNFVVVWESDGSGGTDSDQTSIQGQRFDAAGTEVGAQFQINTYTVNRQGRTSVGVDGGGNFIVVWDSAAHGGSDTSGLSIQGQRFDRAGNSVEGEFQVNTYTFLNQRFPSVAADSDGNFVVAWQSPGSYGTDGSNYSIQGQRFDSAGTTVGGEFQVNSYTTGYQIFPFVGGSSDGSFVVSWYGIGSFGSDTSYATIQTQPFDAAGDAVGAQFQVNTFTTASQVLPAVTLDTDGHATVVWRNSSPTALDSSGGSIQGQRFDRRGNPIGDEFQINTYTTGLQDLPSVVGSRRDGTIVVVWDSDGSAGTDTSGTSIQGQRFAVPIFSDGFESGDLSAWVTRLP